MKPFSSLFALFARLRRKRVETPVFPNRPVPSRSARDRVRSGIEPLEGRIAPAILLNASTLIYTDLDGDAVTVKFSEKVFRFNSVGVDQELGNVFKFSQGTAHKAAIDDGPQQLQLIDLGRVIGDIVNGQPTSRVHGISFTITAEQRGNGDGFANVGAIRSGFNSLGSVTIDGDLGQIDSGSGSHKVGLQTLRVQSLGALGTSTQQSSPTPDLESRISGKLGQLIVADDVGGYLHVVNSLGGRGNIGGIKISGSLVGNDTVGASSNDTGRIEAAYNIGKVRIGTNGADGLFGGAGTRSGNLTAGHNIGSLTISGTVEGGVGEDSGTVVVLGKIGNIQIGGDLLGTAGARSGSIRSGAEMGTVTIGNVFAGGDVRGGSGESSGLVFSGGKMGAVKFFGDVTGGGARSGGIYATGDLVSVEIDGVLRGGTGIASGAVESAGRIGAVTIDGTVFGGEGSGSGSIVAGGALGRIILGGNLDGGAGANSGSIFAGHDAGQKTRDLGVVKISGAMLGDTGAASGTISSGGSIGSVKVGALVASGPAIQGGSGALSGAIIAERGIDKVIAAHRVEGAAGSGSASIEAHGTIKKIVIHGDLIGGTGPKSGSIFANELPHNSRPIAGNITKVIIDGKLRGAGDRSGLIEAAGTLGQASVQGIEGGSGIYSGAIVSGAGFLNNGSTLRINVTGAISGGLGEHSGSIEIGGRLGTLTVGSLSLAEVRVADDLGLLTVQGSVVDSIISARGESRPGRTTDVAFGRIEIDGSVSNSRFLAGVDVFGQPANADAQIGAVRVAGNWTASTISAGVSVGNDGLAGTLDDVLFAGKNRGSIVSKIASVVIRGTVEGTSTENDHFGFVAQQIGRFSVNGLAAALTAAPRQSFEQGTFDDVTVREIG